MTRVVSLLLIFCVACAGVVGCGPSRTERANDEVERLARRANTLFESGDLDDARATIEQALAVEGATERDEAIAAAKQIGEALRQRDTKQFAREAPELLRQAVAIEKEQGAAEALRHLAESLPRASSMQRQLSEALIRRVHEVTSRTAGLAYWKPFEVAALVDLREKDRLPEGWETVVVEPPPDGDAFRAMWRRTLHRTLPEALAAAEIEANRTVDPDHLLPSLTIEEVAADPAAWRDKEVQFEHVWIDGKVTTGAGRGWLLTVKSPAGNIYEPISEQDSLVFATRGTLAKRLESFVSPGQRVQARVFCKITRNRIRGGARGGFYYRATVYKMELYADRE